MLVLNLRPHRAPGAEEVAITLPDGREIVLVLVETSGHNARIGIAAATDISIRRREIGSEEPRR